VSNKEFQSFDTDVQQTGAYQYSAGSQYSAIVANARLSNLTLEAMDWTGLRVLDVGCGDGVYSLELYHRGNPAEIVGIDLSPAAITAANAKITDEVMKFSISSGTRLPYDDDSFDAVHLRGVLHHMENPELAVAEAFRVARHVFIIEPNGWNLGLKCLEKLSSYHREHNEQSYTSSRINSWISGANGVVTYCKWAGFVPYFCSDPLAKCMKLIEPLLEALPCFRQAMCAVYVVVGVRKPFA
jgi:2-polyprenyl-3-methyl-5-hydroxy-6-metoxy-1,4-benzoquinol methylase